MNAGVLKIKLSTAIIGISSIHLLKTFIATSALKASAGFTRLVPTLVVAVGYGLAFWLLSLTLRSIPVGMAYAVWSGIGTVRSCAGVNTCAGCVTAFR